MRRGLHAIILAGVHQWRPSVFERWMPRTLVQIANRPLIEYPLTWLRDGGIIDLRICANSDTPVLRESIGEGAVGGANISYYEDMMPRGPAGCMADAARDNAAETFVVVDATIIPRNISLESCLRAHVESGAVLTVVATSTRFGINGPNALAPCGIYVVSRSALKFIPGSGYQDIKEMLIPRLYDASIPVRTHVIDTPVLRVCGARSCFSATQLVLVGLLSQVEPPAGMVRQRSALIHETARIGKNVAFFGPVLIGPDAVLSDGVTMVGPTTVGAGCEIETGAQVCRSVLWSESSIGSEAYVDQCILTPGAHVVSGAQVERTLQHRAGRMKTPLMRR